jgi:hypothetical protein
MSERAEIEAWIINELSMLVERGFCEPIICRDKWSTSIYWRHGEIAVELQIDLRDLCVSCFLVRLEGGKLPDGYLTSNGKRCRYYLNGVIHERKWQPAGNMLEPIKRKSRRKTPPRNLETMKTSATAYKALLTTCADQIKAEADAIFEPTVTGGG